MHHSCEERYTEVKLLTINYLKSNILLYCKTLRSICLTDMKFCGNNFLIPKIIRKFAVVVSLFAREIPFFQLLNQVYVLFRPWIAIPAVRWGDRK